MCNYRGGKRLGGVFAGQQLLVSHKLDRRERESQLGDNAAPFLREQGVEIHQETTRIAKSRVSGAQSTP